MSEAFELCDESSGGLHGFSQLISFANDPLDLEPVDAAADRLKGDAHAASCVSLRQGLPMPIRRPPGRRET